MIQRREFITLLGSAAAWPLAASAQQPALPVIGYLDAGSPSFDISFISVAAFRKGLADSGYFEGRNVAIEYRWAEGHYDRLPALASDLVRRQAAVIVAGPRGAVLAAKSATTTIPIVFMSGADPVRRGFVASLNRPGGNLTGVTILAPDLTAKRLGLLHEMVPHAAVVAVLSDSGSTDPEFPLEQLRAAARVIGVSIRVERAASERDFETAFANFARDGAGAIFVVNSGFFAVQRERLAALAARYGMPAIYASREFAEAGGLMTYGPSVTDANRQVGVYTARILKGDKPADLPVLLPTTFEFVINAKTAKALNLAVPPSLLTLADEVIE
jgi:putative ABC transport system substrate-binding protein